MSTALTDTITWGYTAPSTIDVYFLSDGTGTGELNFASFTDVNGNTFDADAWTTYEQQQAELAFQQFAAVANVTFNFVSDISQADFVMVTGSTAEVGSDGYWNVGGGTITVDGTQHSVDGVGVFNWQGDGWDSSGLLGTMEVGGRGFVTLLQEIGHGLGLAHPHDGGGSSTVMSGVTSPTGDYGAFGLNQGVYTTMSLNDGWQTAPHGTTPSEFCGRQGTPMGLDIAVLQEIYGATATNLGNTVYELPDSNAQGTYYQAIWDAGGTDTIVYRGSADAVIDLRAATLQYEAGGGGFISYVTGIHGGVTIADGAVIENASGGAGDDTLIGNNADNVLTGGPGADALNGKAGSDTASYRNAAAAVVADLANAASNTGEASGDSYVNIENLHGSRFNDQLNGDAAANALSGGAGADRLFGRAGDDLLYGGPGDDRLGGGGGDDELRGGGGDDVLRGGPGNDRLFGNPGNDRLLAGSGDDVIRGGSGDDIMRGHAGGDRFFGAGGSDDQRGAGGNDILRGGADGDRLFGGGDNDRLFGGGDDDVLRGGAGDDVLRGGPGNDALFGGGGNDRLIGGAGDDQLVGQAGNDRLFGNAGADRFVFQPNGGNDVVTDFQNGVDLLDFRAFNFASEAAVLNMATQVGTDVVFALPGGESVELSDFDIILLGAEDIVI